MAEMHDIKTNSGQYLPSGIKANSCQFLIFFKSMVASASFGKILCP